MFEEHTAAYTATGCYMGLRAEIGRNRQLHVTTEYITATQDGLTRLRKAQIRQAQQCLERYRSLRIYPGVKGI